MNSLVYAYWGERPSGHAHKAINPAVFGGFRFHLCEDSTETMHGSPASCCARPFHCATSRMRIESRCIIVVAAVLGAQLASAQVAGTAVREWPQHSMDRPQPPI